MHQGHNIPWDLISSNFKFVRDDKRFTPPLTGLVGLDKPHAQNELKHLIQKIIRTILTFSETERKKYPQSFVPLLTGTLFSDELRDRYPKYLNERNQRVEYWLQKPNKSDPDLAQPRYESYDGRHAELADVVKVLLHENEMTSLLMLAQHPRVPIRALTYLPFSYQFGFSRAMESALVSYIFFNTAAAMDILENGAYMDMNEYKTMVMRTMTFNDRPDLQPENPLQLFFQQCGMTSGSYHNESQGRDMAVDGDYGRLQVRDHLKLLFALLYRYDLLLRECGLEPKWENELVSLFPFRGVVSVEWSAREV